MSAFKLDTEMARPFLPCKDITISKQFYQTLGFERLLDSEVVIFRAGCSEFILQARYQQQWAENRMMQLRVPWSQVSLLGY
jgi:predicted lactoylglutathione lyase